MFHPSMLDIDEFFLGLARVAHEEFASPLVRIWDNNVHANCLALLTSYPDTGIDDGHVTIPRDSSLTGLAIERCESVYISRIHEQVGRRRLQNGAIFEKLGLSQLVSIPIFNAIDTQLISFVIDLYYNDQMSPEFFTSGGPFKSTLALSWLMRTVGRGLDYLLYRIGDDIVRSIQNSSAKALGFGRLFEDILPDLERYTHSDGAEVYRWYLPISSLVLEHTAGRLVPSQEVSRQDLLSLLCERCIKKNHSLTLSARGQPPLSGSEYPTFMATPILAPSGEALGVLCAVCDSTSQFRRSFSSLDVHILAEFARAIGPILERFMRVRESAFIVGVSKDVSETLVGTQNVDEILHRTLAAVVAGLNCGVGAIYLLDDYQKEQKLTMRAAIGPPAFTNLVGKATYELTEGITGLIASGEAVNFKSWDECRNHPAWRGKYDAVAWPTEGDRASNTLLGVPIQLGNRILGAWKVEDVEPGPKHPDPYFTDEDMQVLRVLATFLAYAIEHHRYKLFMSAELRQLAQSSVEIEQARHEDDAILAILGALERLGFLNPALWLYDQGSGGLKSVIGARGSDESISRTELMEALTAYDPPTVTRARSGDLLIPARLDSELIGVLVVRQGSRVGIGDDDALLLKAFAAHLSISLSRLRNAQRVLELTNEVLGSSRFVVAETLSSMAVHSLRHLMGTIIESLEQDLRKPSIRGREELLDPLRSWHKKLVAGMEDLNNALLVVRSESEASIADAHVVLLATLEMWHSYISQHRCGICHELTADVHRCLISRAALKEIVSVLTVNSVQAHSKHIKLHTYNQRDVVTGVNFNELVWTLEFSDDGDGLATNDPEEIFSPSYSTKRKAEGTGLGLFIAKTLAQNAGGDLLFLDRRPARGATFRLTIPAAV
jgi:signal transduction histidine kinase